MSEMIDFPFLRSAEWLRFDSQYMAQYSTDPTVRSAAKALNDLRNRALKRKQPASREDRRLEARYESILDLASQSTEGHD